MAKHTPTLPHDPDAEAAITPDHQRGAYTNCFCESCREFRLRDERIVYTAHEMADAWTQGWKQGYAKGLVRAGERSGV